MVQVKGKCLGPKQAQLFTIHCGDFQKKGRVIKGFVVCNDWDLENLDLVNGLAPQVVINRPLKY